MDTNKEDGKQQENGFEAPVTPETQVGPSTEPINESRKSPGRKAKVLIGTAVAAAVLAIGSIAWAAGQSTSDQTATTGGSAPPGAAAETVPGSSAPGNGPDAPAATGPAAAGPGTGGGPSATGDIGGPPDGQVPGAQGQERPQITETFFDDTGALNDSAVERFVDRKAPLPDGGQRLATDAAAAVQSGELTQEQADALLNAVALS